MLSYYIVLPDYTTITFPNNSFLNFLNSDPCNGFVNMSAIISFVDLYSTLTSPYSTLSLTKKYLILMCLVRSDVDFPFFTSSIVLMLSWYTVAASMEYPCAMMNSLIQII